MAALAVTGMLWGRGARAVPLLRGFGGASGFGTPDHCLRPNDDGSWAGAEPDERATPQPVDLTVFAPTGMDFFGTRWTRAWVNTNGNVTFAEPFAMGVSVALPVRGRAMVAPWWADVDTRPGGAPLRNEVCFHTEPGRFVVTWNDVGYGDARTDRLDAFQMVLTRVSGCFSTGLDVEFRYARCGWTVAQREGATHALVGLDAGDGRNYVSLPWSRSAAIARVCDESNVPDGPPGLWRFQIRGGAILASCAGAGTPCTVPGAMGLCARGVGACEDVRTVCRALFQGDDERCNGVDDDCDGLVDEDANCGRACDGVRCASSRVCVAGACVDACEGVRCPGGGACVEGRCVDRCEGVRCAIGWRCDPALGACVPGCACNPCPAGEVCLPDGRCVSEVCAAVTCPSGTTCMAGACVDACEGAQCGAGERCVAGACERAEVGAARDAGAARDVDASGAAGAGGCGCRASGASGAGAVGWLIACAVWSARSGRKRARMAPSVS